MLLVNNIELVTTPEEYVVMYVFPNIYEFVKGNTAKMKVFSLTISRNSGQMNMTKNPPESLVEKYKSLPNCYYNVNFAELEDGNWTVIEAGDSSVSGLSENQDCDDYFRAVHYCFN